MEKFLDGRIILITGVELLSLKKIYNIFTTNNSKLSTIFILSILIVSTICWILELQNTLDSYKINEDIMLSNIGIKKIDVIFTFILGMFTFNILMFTHIQSLLAYEEYTTIITYLYTIITMLNIFITLYYLTKLDYRKIISNVKKGIYYERK